LNNYSNTNKHLQIIYALQQLACRTLSNFRISAEAKIRNVFRTCYKFTAREKDKDRRCTAVCLYLATVLTIGWHILLLSMYSVKKLSQKLEISVGRWRDIMRPIRQQNNSLLILTRLKSERQLMTVHYCCYIAYTLRLVWLGWLINIDVRYASFSGSVFDVRWR